MATPSGLERALSQVGDRWSLLVVHALLGGPRRFGEVAEAVPGIAPNILSSRLRALERAGLLVATPYSVRPRRHAYELTGAGRDLAASLRLLAQWGSDHGGGETPAHPQCGTAMEARWWCPTCEAVADPGDDPGEELHYV